MISIIKKYIPWAIKYPFWWIFKAPQRQNGVINTLLIDVSARIFLATKTQNIQPISICVGVKNRSSQLLTKLIPSLCLAQNQDLIELSIFDGNSSDFANLEQEIKNIWKGKLIFNAQDIPFTRASYFNLAVKQSSNALIFISDVDMQLPSEVVKLTNQFVSAKTTWFPICFKLNEKETHYKNNQSGHWGIEGAGIFASYKSDFLSIGGYNEQFTTWGKEDWDLFHRFYQQGFSAIRNKQIGLLHHWHPPAQNKY